MIDKICPHCNQPIVQVFFEKYCGCSSNEVISGNTLTLNGITFYYDDNYKDPYTNSIKDYAPFQWSAHESHFRDRIIWEKEKIKSFIDYFLNNNEKDGWSLSGWIKKRTDSEFEVDTTYESDTTKTKRQYKIFSREDLRKVAKFWKQFINE